MTANVRSAPGVRGFLPELAIDRARSSTASRSRSCRTRSTTRRRWASSCCASRSAPIVLAPFAFRRSWAGPARRPTDTMPYLRARRRVARGRSPRSPTCPRTRAATHDHVELRVHHRPVRRVHADHRSDRHRRFPRTGRPRGRDLDRRPVPADRRRAVAELRRRGHARLRGRSSAAGTSGSAMVANRFDIVALTAVQLAVIALVCDPVRDRRRLRHRRRRRGPARCSSPASAARRSRSPLDVGPADVEPSPGQHPQLFEPVVAGFVGYMVGERLGRRRATSARRDPRRHLRGRAGHPRRRGCWRSRRRPLDRPVKRGEECADA